VTLRRRGGLSPCSRAMPGAKERRAPRSPGRTAVPVPELAGG
jgi:hypothetical protein